MRRAWIVCLQYWDSSGTLAGENQSAGSLFTTADQTSTSSSLRSCGGLWRSTVSTGETLATASDAADVPKDRDDAEMSAGVPITYVPARNTIFLAYALAWAEVLDAPDVFIGVNAIDYSGYPDCRPEFIEAFERAANLGTKFAGRFKIHAPLIRLSKAQIIQRGVVLGVDYGQTHSCYDPDATGAACGHCDSCLLRKRGFAEARVPDPTRYRSR